MAKKKADKEGPDAIDEVIQSIGTLSDDALRRLRRAARQEMDNRGITFKGAVGGGPGGGGDPRGAGGGKGGGTG